MTRRCWRLGEPTGLSVSASSPDPRVPAVRSSELLNSRETALDAFYCQPGIDGAHEKGGVEGQIGWFRRNHLVPVPEVASIGELNAMIDQWDEQDEAQRTGGRARTVGEFLESSGRC